MVLEHDALGNQRIDVGRLHMRMTKRADAIGTPLVGADEENVGFLAVCHFPHHLRLGAT
jgi:hypothetical protein